MAEVYPKPEPNSNAEPELYDPDSLEGILAEADVVRGIVYELFGEEDPVIKEGTDEQA